MSQGNKGSIIDNRALYRAGYTSSYEGNDQAGHTAKLFSMLGEIAINHLDTGMMELGKLKQGNPGLKESEAVNKMGPNNVFQPKVIEALKGYSDEYNKGAKIVAFWPAYTKKYDKGIKMMNAAKQKMIQLNGDLEGIMTAAEYNKSVFQGEETDDEGNAIAFNSGTYDEQHSNTAKLISGSLYGNMRIDPATGRVMIDTQVTNVDKYACL